MNNGNSVPFPSLGALRTAHNSLLQAHREQSDLQTLLPEIENFLHRGQATGALLDVEQERWTAQSLLDYWTATALSASPTGTPPVHDAMLADFDPNLAPEIPDDRCPFVGLDAFREREEWLLFWPLTAVKFADRKSDGSTIGCCRRAFGQRQILVGIGGPNSGTQAGGRGRQ